MAIVKKFADIFGASIAGKFSQIVASRQTNPNDQDREIKLAAYEEFWKWVAENKMKTLRSDISDFLCGGNRWEGWSIIERKAHIRLPKIITKSDTLDLRGRAFGFRVFCLESHVRDCETFDDLAKVCQRFCPLTPLKGTKCILNHGEFCWHGDNIMAEFYYPEKTEKLSVSECRDMALEISKLIASRRADFNTMDIIHPEKVEEIKREHETRERKLREEREAEARREAERRRLAEVEARLRREEAEREFPRRLLSTPFIRPGDDESRTMEQIDRFVREQNIQRGREEEALLRAVGITEENIDNFVITRSPSGTQIITPKREVIDEILASNKIEAKNILTFGRKIKRKKE